MTAVVDQVVDFMTESEFWAENVSYLRREDVIHHEINIETNLHPLGLEFLFLEYLRFHNRDVRNVGHAIVGDIGYIKIYTVSRPIVNIVWRYASDIVIGPSSEKWFTTWTDDDERQYLERVKPRKLTSEDSTGLTEYFVSPSWQQILRNLEDPEMEHFHVFVRTELDPHELGTSFRDALIAAGYEMRVPVFFLAQPEEHPLAEPGREAMWIGLIPDGTTSLEISCIYAQGVLLEPKELSDAERLYGGEGWTVTQLKEFIRRAPYEILTLNEAKEILKTVTRVGSPI